MIVPGELRHLVEVMAKQPLVPAKSDKNRNDYGERETTWQYVAKVYAKITPMSGFELERAKSFGAKVSHKIKCRYTPLIIPGTCLRLGDKSYLVNAALNVEERNVELAIYATEFLGEQF
ncbi:MAG: phage head closure protein [Phycisphaerales bacterium]|nr:phage head closure protein [Phycisphaerales bacterium]